MSIDLALGLILGWVAFVYIFACLWFWGSPGSNIEFGSSNFWMPWIKVPTQAEWEAEVESLFTGGRWASGRVREDLSDYDVREGSSDAPEDHER